MQRARALLTTLALSAAVVSFGCESTPASTSTQSSSATPTTVATSSKQHFTPSAYDKPGFVTTVYDGRLWVFKEGSKDLADFKAKGEPAKFVTRPGVGPNRMSVRAVEGEHIVEYTAAKPGFTTIVHDGRLWVFPEGSKHLAEFKEKGEPAKFVTRPGAGPFGMSIRAVESEHIVEYAAAKPGYTTQVHDGRLWVFPEGSKHLAEFKAKGEPAKFVTRPGAGPFNMSIRAIESEDIVNYLVSQPGFHTVVHNGRLWVFPEGCKSYDEFKAKGEPAKFVTRPGAGPLNMSVRAVESETIAAYLAARG